VVTASSDSTARVWEADTGKPVGAPLQHQGMVLAAAFSPDGHRVVTASYDGKVRVWEVLLACCRSREEADRLADLAEAVSGNVVTDEDSLTTIKRGERLQRLDRLNGRTQDERLILERIRRAFASPE